jgi:hypothetical protein
MAFALWPDLAGDSLTDSRSAPLLLNAEAAHLAEAIGFPEHPWPTDEPYPDFTGLEAVPYDRAREEAKRLSKERDPARWRLPDRAAAGGRAKALRHAA